jgi:hypothetical protein
VPTLTARFAVVPVLRTPARSATPPAASAPARRRAAATLAAFMVAAHLATAGAHAAATLRRVFVTSVAGNGDLGSWDLPIGVPPIPPGVNGVEAGDFICFVLSLDAGLPDPGSFTAWLSDSNDDAFCRLLGLHGKKADDCGQSPLVPDAGPWARVDDLPFAESLLAITGGEGPASVVLTPPLLNQHGDPDLSPRETWTGTGPSGVATSATCFDWRSSAAHDSGAFGSHLRTVNHWTLNGASACDSPRRLLCLQRGSGPAPPSAVRGGRFAFVTSVTGTGELGSWPDAGGATGIAAGDAICRARAAAGGLAFPETFKAWLSDDDTDARDRFTNGPWIRLDGFRLGASLAAIADGFLDTAIDRDELGRPMGGLVDTWTGTLPLGTRAADNCGDWTADAAGVEGRSGIAVGATNEWTSGPRSSCANSFLRLYCLSDAHPDLLFADGFEAGSTRLWSGGTQPEASRRNGLVDSSFTEDGHAR